MRKKSGGAKFLKKLIIILYGAEFGPGVTSGPCHPASYVLNGLKIQST